MYKSQLNPMFRNELSETIFNTKYKHEGAETWSQLADTLVEQVCIGMTRNDKDQLKQYIKDLKFIPGGRYLYYAGRPLKYFNNCYLLKSEEDTREDWASLSWKAETCLSTGGGIGNDYSIYRPEGYRLTRTGGVASGPISKMRMINEIGREIMQGGSRRSAIYASLSVYHPDIFKFLVAKDWDKIKVPGTNLSLADVKRNDFNFPCPLDMTNISVNYNTNWLENYKNTGDVDEIFKFNVLQAMRTGEPGFSFNFYEKENETLRNACTEVTSSDDSDVCNLGSINLSRIDNLEELKDVITLGTMFLLHGTLIADLPYDKVHQVREKNRRLGLGLMGVHEWFIQRSKRYEVDDEFKEWLQVYEYYSNKVSKQYSQQLSISRPIADRAIAPTGTIGMLAGTTTGIEPLYAVAYKRRYLSKGTRWKYQYYIDHAAQGIIDETGCDPNSIESAIDLANDPERRIKFQADVQDYVDMSISSTINLPVWGSDLNNEDKAEEFGNILALYSPRLRGFTCYPDGARGGQPLSSVDYNVAKKYLGEEFEESTETSVQMETSGMEINDICNISGKGGFCGS